MTAEQQHLITIRDKLERLNWERKSILNEMKEHKETATMLMSFMSNGELYNSQKVLEQIDTHLKEAGIND